MFSATQIGFLINFMIPARMGEFFRAYVLARLEKFPLSQAVAMVTLDRVSDIFGLLTILLVSALSFHIEQDIILSSDIFNTTENIVISTRMIQTMITSITIFLLIILGVLILLYFKQNMVLDFIDRFLFFLSPKFSKRLQRLFVNFAGGMHIFRSHIDLLKSTGFSLLTWGANILSITAIFKAFSISFPWYTSFLMISMISVFIVFPLIPGLVGQYHFAVIACLLIVIPDMQIALAKAVAIVTHVLTLIPIIVLGIFCLLKKKLNILEITDCYQSKGKRIKTHGFGAKNPVAHDDTDENYAKNRRVVIGVNDEFQ